MTKELSFPNFDTCRFCHHCHPIAPTAGRCHLNPPNAALIPGAPGLDGRQGLAVVSYRPEVGLDDPVCSHMQRKLGEL